jgi:PTS system mannose-specific IIB component/fructoselysine and glucoselysine-specific PTS system IIB component
VATGAAVPIELFRIDDRLIHGQVVVGWGEPLDVGFIVLVDDEVAASDWEQELYRLGVPPRMDVHFDTVAGAVAAFDRYQGDARAGILLTKDIDTMERLAERVPVIHTINLGGLHFRDGRAQKLRYVFLDCAEEGALRQLAARGVVITAQDVPAARPVALSDVLASRGGGSA